MARMCSVCGKKADTAFQTGNVLGSSVICWNCYRKIKSFSVQNVFKTPEELDANEAAVMKELEENDFPQEVIEDYLTWFDRKRNPDQYVAAPVNTAMITSSGAFAGYRITQYYGLVSGEAILPVSALTDSDEGIGGLLSGEASGYGQAVGQAREAAAYRAMKETVGKGGNAVIGAELTLTPVGSDMVCVMVSGIAVYAVKNEAE